MFFSAQERRRKALLRAEIEQWLILTEHALEGERQIGGKRIWCTHKARQILLVDRRTYTREITVWRILKRFSLFCGQCCIVGQAGIYAGCLLPPFWC